MQLKWGILGASLISGDFVRSMRSLDPNHHKVIGIAATDLDRAKEFAFKFNIPKTYGSYLEMAQDPEITVVYLGNKSILHFQAAKLMIENKKHVLIEKPMTTSVETTRELFELGAKNGVLVLEALFTRWTPAMLKLRELLSSGAIGSLVHIQSSFVMGNTSDPIISSRFGGGVSFAIGCYGLNAILEAVNYKVKPEVIKAIGRWMTKSEKTSGDVTVSALLDFPASELTASMLLTLRGPSDCKLDELNQTSYIGTKGVIRINKLNNPSEIRLITPNGEQTFNTSTDDGQSNYWLDNSHGLRFQCEEVRKCILENRITSEVHGPDESILLAEITRKIMDECKFEVADTPRGSDFSYF